MATQQELADVTDAVTALGEAVSSLGVSVLQAFKDLEAAINSGTPAADLKPQLAALRGQIQTLADLKLQAVAADATVNLPPTP